MNEKAGGGVTLGRAAPGAAPRLGWVARHIDVALAIAVCAIFGSMIVPLPAGILDVLIATNLALAAVLLALALQVTDALQISAFPSLLLLTTLFRLGLEISATRLVLLHASAGQVIHAFGSFVVGGSLVVGLVVFSILTLVQYIVISKGAERVAEVAARFTLDAMPGKQMAIDADLRGGFIDSGEARRRRAAITRESQLFGSMDGAMKFVKGDAIAGLVILAINLVGGLAIGVFEHGMAMSDAVRTYAVLTIGGGLVAQIPALVISTAAGIVVTRVASEEEGGATRLGVELARQLGEHPKAFAVASALLLVLALVPGLPMWPFLLLGAGTGALAWRQFRAARAHAVATDSARLAPPPYVVGRAVTIVLGTDLGDEIGDEIRRALASHLGFDLPSLRVETDAGAALGSQGYAIRLGEAREWVGSWELPSPGVEVPRIARARHLARAIAAHAGDLVGVQETDAWLAAWQHTHPILVREVVPKVISLPRMTELLRALVGEGVSLRHAVAIFEALASQGTGLPTETVAILERVRGALGRSLVATFLGGEPATSRLRVIELEALIEDTIRDGVRNLGAGSARTLAIEPALSKDIVSAIAQAVARVDSVGPPPIVLTQRDIRRHVRTLIAANLPEVAVLAFSELPGDVPVEYVGRARIG